MPHSIRHCFLFAFFVLSAAATSHANPLLLFDPANGKVLYAEDIDRPWYPASLTKIMTAYVAFDAIRRGELALDGKLVSSENAIKEPPSKIGLPVGAEIPVELGLRALIVKSANDVAIMLAEKISGSSEAFVQRMNETAARLGMTGTHFVNPNGLPVEGQKTTARDLVKLSVAVLNDFPEYAAYWGMPYVRVGKFRLRSHNSLLRTFDGADGIKTGFICDAGFNIVASATRNGRRLIAVVLGAPSARDRGARAQALLEHGFLTYDWKEYFAMPTLNAIAPEGRDEPLASIREDVSGWSCHPRTAQRSHARRLRRASLDRARLRRQAAARDRNNATTTGTPPPPAAISR